MRHMQDPIQPRFTLCGEEIHPWHGEEIDYVEYDPEFQMLVDCEDCLILFPIGNMSSEEKRKYFTKPTKEDIDQFATSEESEILKEYIGKVANPEPNKKNLVLISVSGGVAELMQKPKGVEVKIVDYDAEMAGDERTESVWDAEDEILGEAHLKEKKVLKENDQALEASAFVTDEILEKAQGAFWAEIAASFPSIKTGDFSPESTIAFDEACKNAVIDWVTYNHPDLQDKEEDEDEIRTQKPWEKY